jgi:hypothetical protein
MAKFLGILAVAMAVVMLSHQAAYAGGGDSCSWLFEILGLCSGGSGSGGGSPAPAPLLAAGIPAFAALGGGVLVTRLFRKRQTRD